LEAKILKMEGPLRRNGPKMAEDMNTGCSCNGPEMAGDMDAGCWSKSPSVIGDPGLWDKSVETLVDPGLWNKSAETLVDPGLWDKSVEKFVGPGLWNKSAEKLVDPGMRTDCLGNGMARLEMAKRTDCLNKACLEATKRREGKKALEVAGSNSEKEPDTRGKWKGKVRDFSSLRDNLEGYSQTVVVHDSKKPSQSRVYFDYFPRSFYVPIPVAKGPSAVLEGPTPFLFVRDKWKAGKSPLLVFVLQLPFFVLWREIQDSPFQSLRS
jgi:hypothetical protein